jgi:hypothetical protein
MADDSATTASARMIVRMAHILLLLALLGAGGLAVRQKADTAEVACGVKNDQEQRQYRLRKGASDTWEIGVRSRRTRDRWVSLALPGAAPTIEAGRARLSYKAANGGRIVEWTVAPDATSIDVYVSYELEVNVDTTLEPEIDLLNTEGALRHLDCRVTILKSASAKATARPRRSAPSTDPAREGGPQ